MVKHIVVGSCFPSDDTKITPRNPGKSVVYNCMRLLSVKDSNGRLFNGKA